MQFGGRVPADFAAPFNGDWKVVPVPAAIWLFASGVLALMAVVSRKRAG